MKKLILTFFTIALLAGMAVAQDYNDNNVDNHTVKIKVPKIALLDIESSATGGSNAITLSVRPDNGALYNPTAINLTGEAGLAPLFDATNEDLWLNITSIVGSGATRTVTAKLIGGGVLPGGISLKVLASQTTTGKGTHGTPASEKTLSSTTAETIITGIGTKYSENGNAKGNRLKYSLSMDAESYATLFAADFDITVEYTLSDN